MQKVVIIGSSSYTASGLQQQLNDCCVQELSHRNWEEHLAVLQSADYVISFAISPEFSQRPVSADEVLDIQIARHLQHCKTKYVFISSRKVYGSHDECKTHGEDDELIGGDDYASNKIMAEKELFKLLGERLLVLRIANVIGEPVRRANYKTFMGWICQNIHDKGSLDVAQNSHSFKDFITKDFLHRSIAILLKNNCRGIYNISSGFAISIRELLNGYVGESRVHYIGDHLPVKDQFILDNSKLLHATSGDISLTKSELFDALSNYRNQLMSSC